MRANSVLAVDDSKGKRALPEELRSLARDVRRIGDGWRSDPESVAIQKDDVSKRLVLIAQRLEAGRG